MREAGAEGFPCFGVDAGGAGRAVAAAKVVGTDDKKAVGINGFAGANHFIPPTIVEFLSPKVTALGGLGMLSGEVMGSREGMEDENRVRLIFVQGSPSGVSKLSGGNAPAFSEGEIA